MKLNALTQSIFLIALSALSFFNANGGGLIETNLSLSSFSMSSYKTRANSFIYSRNGMFLTINQAYSIYLGAGVSYLSQSTETTTAESMSVIDYYFGVKYSFDSRDKMFWMGLNFAPITQASFKADGASQETWSGLAGNVNLTVFYPSRSSWLIGFSIDYYYSSFNKSSTDTTSSSITQNNTGIVPCVSLAYSWGGSSGGVNMR